MDQHQSGHVAVAQALYERLLAEEPRDPDALHLLGVLHAQLSHHDEAARLIGQAVVERPEEPMFHNNLGNVHFELERFDEACAAYRCALALAPGRADVCNNLGVLLGRTGQAAEAEALLRRACELAPAYVDARENLANHLLRQGRLQEAMEVCVAALITAPRSPALRGVLGVVYCSLGMNQAAEALYRGWLAEEPDNAEARFRLIACTQQGVPDRAPDRFVAATFDAFAASFDAKLATLAYRAPELVAEDVARHAGVPLKSLAVLDAGCGTGLCGPLIAPWARHLVGVDLSAGMVARAQARRVYGELVVGEMVAFLHSRPQGFELMVCADTLCYFGALEGFAAAARQALRSEGLLVLTVESHANSDDAPDYRLNGHGRYSHRSRYVELALRAAGLLALSIRPVELRMEAGKSVQGLLVAARASAEAINV
jgi:predicted TPR repeat methyltransferase